LSVSAVERQLYLLRALDGWKSGRTAEDLHRELRDDLGVEVSLRTVYRDLDCLSRVFPVTEEVRDGKCYYFMLDGYKLEGLQCSFAELMALVFMNRLLEALGSDPVVDAGKELTRKLISTLPELQQSYLRAIYQHFRVELPGGGSREGQILKTFIEAVRLHREVHIRYHAFASDECSERIIHPYTIYFRHQYYIVAYCTVRKAIREFRLDRILEAQLLETGFQPDPSFNYDDYSTRCWDVLKGEMDYRVVLRFSPEYSRFVREYHGQRADKLVDLPDGSLEFHKSVSTLEEIFPWVLSHGHQVEVLAPEELKNKVTETVAEQARNLKLI